MLSATRTTIKKALQHTWICENGNVSHMKNRFQNLPYFKHSNTYFRNEERKPTKTTPNQTTIPMEFIWQNPTVPCWASQSFYTALPKMDLCSKWPVKRQRKPKPKGTRNTETRPFLWALVIASYLFSRMGVNLLSSQKKTPWAKKKVTKRDNIKDMVWKCSVLLKCNTYEKIFLIVTVQNTLLFTLLLNQSLTEKS